MNNPIAVITGASRGLGRALAAGLAREGYTLIIDARDAGRLQAAAHAVQGHRIRAPGGQAAGGADLLVNNAGDLGASPLPALADYPAGELRDAFEVNVIAPIALTQL